MYAAFAFWSFYSLIILLSGLIYYPIPALLTLGVAILACWWLGGNHCRFAGFVCVLLCGALLYGAAGYYVYLGKISKTFEYVDRAIPTLERIHLESGKYPAALPTQVIGLPEGFLTPRSYRSNGDVYCFDFWDGMTLWWCYELLSDEKEWLSYHSRHPDRRSAAKYQFPK